MTIANASLRQPHDPAVQPGSTLTTSAAPALQSVSANEPPINDAPLDSPRANADRELALNYAQGLRQATGAPGTHGSIMLDIPPNSTFGLWWAQLARAFKSPDVVQWMAHIGLDPSSVSIEPFTGRLYGRINGVLDVLTPGPGDRGWSSVNGPIQQAVENLAGNNPRRIKPAMTENSQRASFEQVKGFYFEPNLSDSERARRAEEIERNNAPLVLHDKVFGALNEARSEQSLDVQQVVLGNIALKQTLLGKLRGLKPNEARQLTENMKRITMNVHPDSSYGRQTGVKEATLEDVLEGNGWSLPENSDPTIQLQLLINGLTLPKLPEQRDGNLGGALSWPEPVSVEDQKVVYSLITRNNLGLPGLDGPTEGYTERGDKGALGYLTKGRHWTPAQLNNPRNVLDQILESGKAQELGKVVQSKMGAVETYTSAREWALTAIVATLDSESIYSPKPHHVAGFDLSAGANYGQPASVIKQRLIDHLVRTRKATAEMAPIAAMILLSRVAPELQIKDTPPNVTYGSFAWASLKAAVARIEALSPGASAQMTFAQVVQFDAVDPVPDEERDIQDQAQLSAVTEWGVVNGTLSKFPPHSPAQIKASQDAMALQGQALADADDALQSPLPTQRSVALAALRTEFGDGIPFEEKSIRSNRVNTDSHRLTPSIVTDSRGTYSLLDIYLSGKIDEDTGWHWPNKNINLNNVLARIKKLPDPKAKHAEKFAGYKSAIEKAYVSITKNLIANLPLEDRKNIEWGEITAYRQGKVERSESSTHIGTLHNERPYPVQPDDNRSLLIKTTRNGQVAYYEFNPQKNTIARQDKFKDTFKTGVQGEWVLQPSNETLRKTYTNTSIVEVPPGEDGKVQQQAGISSADNPASFSSARSEYLGQLLSRNVSVSHRFGEQEAAAKAVTTFDEEQEQQKMWRETILGFIPGLSVIRNIAKGDYVGALGDVIFDGVMYAVTAGFGKGASALKGSRFSAARRFGQSLFKRITPKLGSYNGFSSGGSPLRTAVPSAQAVKGARFTKAQLQEIAQRTDLYVGTYKVPGGNATGRTVAKFDEATGKWLPYNPATKKPYGRPLDDFKPIESTHLDINWNNVTRKAENGPDALGFRDGYVNGDPGKVPGYSPKMKSEQVKKLATNGKLSARDIGTLVRQRERLAVQASLNGANTFNNIVRTAGGRITPMPQLFYLSQTQPLSKGECAALSHLMAQAIKKGKSQVLIDNFYKAAANPTAASSKKFIATLTDLQRKVQSPTAFHGGPNVKAQPYTTVASELSSATQSKTLMFGDEGHAMTAGVVIDGNAKSFFFYEPNYGVAHFPDADSFERGVSHIFTSKDFGRRYATAGDNPKVLEFKISAQDDSVLRNMGVNPRALEELYTVPL
ncbi:hypothetical protein [Pseudomonas sp. S2.OTC.A_B10]|uniref:hypothetical protein n=1 Tax=Pseudomonas sp. S2.OTC.A_B10 TaxID=3237018 RepID=UPI003CF0E209